MSLSASEAIDDYSNPLREGLILLCRRLDRPISVAELGEGLPLQQGRLPLTEVKRALRRASVNARVVKRPLSDFSPRLLPALLLFENGDTVLLEALDDEEARLALPETDGGEEIQARETLEANYSGIAIFARPMPCSDDRAGNFAQAAPTHWLKGPLKACWRSYAEVGAATLTANLLAI